MSAFLPSCRTHTRHLQPAGAARAAVRRRAEMHRPSSFSTATSPKLTASLVCQNKNLATSDN